MEEGWEGVGREVWREDGVRKERVWMGKDVSC